MKFSSSRIAPISHPGKKIGTRQTILSLSVLLLVFGLFGLFVSVDECLEPPKAHTTRVGLFGGRKLSAKHQHQNSVIPTPPTPAAPTDVPGDEKSQAPTTSAKPSLRPHLQPSVSSIPSVLSLNAISDHPSDVHSAVPTTSTVPSVLPSDTPSKAISDHPSDVHSAIPTTSTVPSVLPSDTPSQQVSTHPTVSLLPSGMPSVSNFPSAQPSTSQQPSQQPSTLPSQPPSTTKIAVAGAAGTSHTCALNADSSVSCWGSGSDGQLGTGLFFSSSVPVSVVVNSNGELFTDVVELAAGGSSSCAIVSNSSVYCWGRSRLQSGTFEDDPFPSLISGISDASDITAGDEHICATALNGSVYCWGKNLQGQLGDGSQVSSEDPVEVSGLNNVKQLDAGDEHTCAVNTTGSLFCWGNNDFGQLGIGTSGYMTFESTPTEVGLNNVKHVATGIAHTCAVNTTGSLFCWGWNKDGQLGLGTSSFIQTTPKVGGLENVERVAGGVTHTCAVNTTGSLFCWGANFDGQLGIGQTSNDQTTPTEVDGLNNVDKLPLGWFHSCAITTDLSLYCWGRNFFGHLGIGTTLRQYEPASVVGYN